MITIAWYFLKVIICSGILCGYYYFALRNKLFHRWNRFYLLATIVISLIVPVMKINIFSADEDNGTVVTMLQTISYGDEAVVKLSRHNAFQLTTENVTETAYLLISAIFLLVFFLSLYKINRLKKKFPKKKFDDISFIETNAKGTPFSFFKNIFWNKAIDIHSTSGQQIFNHEIAHIKEKHSYDKIFMNILLIFFWINPFFWLIRKELYMIHEFIADKEAMEDSDVNAFAAMILQTIYPGQNFSLGNNFFYSPLKRRILMLTKNKNPKVSYISRLLVLPLASIVFFAFTLKIKNKNTNLYNGKTITVVIDAGHGGDDNGAYSADGFKEKDITLSIAKKIAELNLNPHLEILLSRKDDYPLSVKDRAEFAKSNNANLFISIHTNAAVNEQLNGFSVLIDKNNGEQNLLLGSALISQLKKSYKTEEQIGTRTNGVWVLDHNVCPAALVECGYLSNPADAAFISNSADQDKIAKNILDAINVYASSLDKNISQVVIKDSVSNSQNDSTPHPTYYKGKKIKNLNVIKFEPRVKITYDDGTNEVITQNEALKRGIVLPQQSDVLIFIDGKKSSKEDMESILSENIESINVFKGKKATDKYGENGKNGVIEITTKNHIPENTLIIIDGKESSKQDLDKITSDRIESVTVLKGEEAVKKYGNKAKIGSIEIITKKNVTISSVKDTMPDKVFTKVENEASFPGGQSAWFKYISKAITDSISKFKNADYGTCVLRFIINVDGSVSDVTATTMKGTELAKVSINAIKNGPKWIPASQNGHIVAAYRLQPVTLQSPNQKTSSKNPGPTITNTKNEDRKIYVKAEKEASFPGGLIAWSKYISRAIQDSIDKFTEADYGTCVLRFIVDVDGSVNDVTATTMQGTELAKVSINAIKKGPRWIPAWQNGHSVPSFRLQPVTLTNPGKKTVSESNFSKLQKPASFPGGNSTWLKYITGAIQKNANELTADKNSQGICKVRFIVSKDGSVSDVQAVTKQDSKLADVAVNAIENGPHWIPGMQNGGVVNSLVIQPVSFALNDKPDLRNEPQ